MAKTAFVTGGTGFVGLNLVNELLKRKWQVTVLHRPASDLRLLKALGPVDYVIGDITEKGTLKGVVPKDVDCVYHVAGNTSLWAKGHAEQLRVNVKGTRNVVRAALDAGAKRFVHTSSIVAFGLHGGTITEDTPTRGTTAKINYIRSKALAEREVRKGISQGLKAVLVNPSNMMGPFDTMNWARMFKLVLQGRLPAMPPGGGSFCHVREAARMHIAAAEQGKVGHNYLLGGAQASYLTLAQEMSKLLGVRRRFVAVHPKVFNVYAQMEEWVAPLFGREPDVTRDAVALLSLNIYCHSRKAQKELGYEPQTLETMLRDCYEWIVQNRVLKG